MNCSAPSVDGVEEFRGVEGDAPYCFCGERVVKEGFWDVASVVPYRIRNRSMICSAPGVDGVEEFRGVEGDAPYGGSCLRKGSGVGAMSHTVIPDVSW